MEAVDLDHIPAAYKALRDTFDSGVTLDLEWRRNQILALGKMVEENEEALAGALQHDLHKSKHDAYVAELAQLLAEVREAATNIYKWAAPQGVSVPMLQIKGMSTAAIQPQPLGLVLVIAPWNYPVNLCLCPLIGALSAGNCVALKPSEVAVQTSKVLTELIPKYLDTSAVKVIEGAVPETTALLKLKWDHIFYTGNGTVGRIVMRAAAEHLTPVTLELGGKSPCIVDKEVDQDVAARRIIWGKFANAGQTCIAPDYLLIHQDILEEFSAKLVKQITEFYGDNPAESIDYGRVINDRHVRRLATLLEDVPKESILAGGQFDAENHYMAPTLLKGLPIDSCKAMEDEIFGPILPMFPIANMDEALGIINSRPKPLALYLFSKNSHHHDAVMERTTSGGLVINDTLVHFVVPDLPFGGVGESGMGAYHGKASFDTFSHRRSVLNKTTWFDASARYPPYNDTKQWVARKILG
eukprot:TRINITY_DN1069_c0_g1_i1.p1 TRINITY_DN1069_c0_g1~~TRINITY_DN1069_c0_g1_i1.p1  ORF type:complete len:469 (-),score=78.96 TRINITY_DN1069_c0_g1_i1:152-1558(-)